MKFKDIYFIYSFSILAAVFTVSTPTHAADECPTLVQNMAEIEEINTAVQAEEKVLATTPDQASKNIKKFASLRAKLVLQQAKINQAKTKSPQCTETQAAAKKALARISEIQNTITKLSAPKLN